MKIVFWGCVSRLRVIILSICLVINWKLQSAFTISKSICQKIHKDLVLSFAYQHAFHFIWLNSFTGSEKTKLGRKFATKYHLQFKINPDGPSAKFIRNSGNLLFVRDYCCPLIATPRLEMTCRLREHIIVRCLSLVWLEGYVVFWMDYSALMF